MMYFLYLNLTQKKRHEPGAYELLHLSPWRDVFSVLNFTSKGPHLYRQAHWRTYSYQVLHIKKDDLGVLIKKLICLVGWKSRNDGIQNSKFGIRNIRNTEYSEYSE